MLEKQTEQLLIRITPSLLERLNTVCLREGLEKTEFVRAAIEADVSRRERDAAFYEVRRLHAAGIDLSALVDYELARKAAEEAQAQLPGIFGARRKGGL
jgi:predicted DNA-binding protein